MSNNNLEAANLANIERVITQASMIWSAGIPADGSLEKEGLLSVLKFKRRQMLEGALAYLKANYRHVKFPGASYWLQALVEVGKVEIIEKKDNPMLSIHRILDRNVFEFEKQAVDMVLDFKAGSSLASEAIAGDWWGHIYQNYVVDQRGAANYLYSGLLFQQKILGLVPWEQATLSAAVFFRKPETIEQVKQMGVPTILWDEKDLVLFREEAEKTKKRLKMSLGVF